MEFPNQPTFNIYCKAGVNLFVTVRNGDVVLAPANSLDKFQQWYKVEKSTSTGSCFVLINRATGYAIKHPAANRPVKLIPYWNNINDGSILWTEWNDGDGEGYRSIRMVYNTNLCWDVNGGDVRDGAPVGVDYWFGKDIERWMIVPCAPVRSIVRVFCKAGLNYSISARNNRVVLASTNPHDKFQQWYRVEANSSCFVLINSVTGYAIKHPAANQPVELIPYTGNIDDESILWTEWNVSDGYGYKSIRMVSNTNLCWDVNGGNVMDGAFVGVDYWFGKDIEQWIVEPCAPIMLPPMRSLVRVYCKAGPNYSISVRDNKVVLASTNPHDKFQQWYKVDNRDCCFVLINSATGYAIKHPAANQPVELIPFSGNIDDESILWTEWNVCDEYGFKSIRMVNNTNLCWDVNGGNVMDGAPVGVDYWFGKDIEQWMIAPFVPLPPCW